MLGAPVPYNSSMPQSIHRVIDLLDPALNHISNMDLEQARRHVQSGDPAAVRAIDGSFAIVPTEDIHRYAGVSFATA